MNECVIASPLGPVLVVAEHEHITAVRFIDEMTAATHLTTVTDSKLLQQACEQLRRYFAGELAEFDVPLAPKGTIFQQQVWRQLARIPFGTTCSYQAIATGIANPKAVRAVGLANSRNPIAIMIPCHRVIGANGHLTGYAGGLDKKTWLLNHEGWQPGEHGC